jgi:integral membrane protein
MTVARFRWIALAESVSWLVLIGAVVAKYAFGHAAATATVGPVHGVLFLAYLAGVLFLREELGWGSTRTAVAVSSALIPLGAYLVVERRMLPAT